ncbi:acetylcholine receptor subunit beta-like 2 isoform X1 [Artemia franciscana]|uniref:acetylcholine receptor subunit beta-like 2 isoform X1 n=1 Tax=Artemia franciscana TaxID=6661 RepID=UPI0032DBDA69
MKGNSKKLVPYIFLVLTFIRLIESFGSPDAKRLYDDLLSNYNRLIRPVENNTDIVKVYLGLKLSQLIDVNLKNQVMTTNVWVEQRWMDYKLVWDPEEYGGVEMLYVPSEHIWLPDIVLYNNADGNYEVTLMTKATVKSNGEVVWKPPAIYKSSCEINVEWFPFDKQSCIMKFGSWTYDGGQVDLRLMHEESDLSEFYLSVEWDILEVPAKRNEDYFPFREEPYIDVTFTMVMRRKTLFYTVNLIIPCVGITFLTVLVFYLPSDSGEKVTLCISILVSLTVFFLLLAEIIPPTSLAVPLLGKYLLFTMILVTLSICVTVGVLNVHFRSPSTHCMSPWMKKLFIELMPRILCMRRPDFYYRRKSLGFYSLKESSQPTNESNLAMNFSSKETFSCDNSMKRGEISSIPTYDSRLTEECISFRPDEDLPPEIRNALRGVMYIANHMRNADKDLEVVEDWKYVATVLDRFFLWVFTIACFVGTIVIVLLAPSLHDTTQPIDQKLSTIQFGVFKPPQYNAPQQFSLLSG